MLKFNPKNILRLRGIEKTTAFLVGLGMSYPMASRFLKSESRYVKIKDIEDLCIALNCTPNELFEWQADAKTLVPEQHSLRRLEANAETKNAETLQQMVKDIPPEKLGQIKELLDELKR